AISSKARLVPRPMAQEQRRLPPDWHATDLRQVRACPAPARVRRVVARVCLMVVRICPAPAAIGPDTARKLAVVRICPTSGRPRLAAVRAFGPPAARPLPGVPPFCRVVARTCPAPARRAPPSPPPPHPPRQARETADLVAFIGFFRGSP